MKRILFLAIPIAATLASCSNNEITEGSNTPNDGRKPIEVTTYTPRTTRYFNATEATSSTLTEQGGGFSLTAATGREEYIFEEKLFYANAQGSKCSSANGEIFYWPEEGTVTFYAYAPMADGTQTDDPDICTLDAYNDVLYVTPDGETDVIAAYTTVDATETGGTVSLAFQHVLAQVQLNVSRNATGLPENAVFQLDSISIYAATTSTVFLDNGSISGNSSISKYFTFYNRITGMDKPIILSDNPSKVATGMLSAFGTMVPKDNPTAETSCPIAVAYSVTIGASTRQYVKRGNINLIAGYKNVVNITVSSDKPISITAEVGEWKEGETQEIAFNGGSGSSAGGSTFDANGHEYVDLGLPSGLLWAKTNIGSSSPEGYGNYYGWGETKAYGEEDTSNATNYSYTATQGTATYTKSYYGWETYKYCDGTNNSFTKYYSSVDNKKTLDAEDDAASVNWGGSWRMPTLREFQELFNNCTRERTDDYNGTGVAGFVFTSSNGNSIFLPAAGCRYEAGLDDATVVCYYWSSTVSTQNALLDDALAMLLASDIQQAETYCDRSLGIPVRAVIKP